MKQGQAASAQKIILHPSGASLSESVLGHWNARSLLFQLAMRDVRLRYRHTFLGAGWAVLQPLVPMLIFATIFSRLHADSGGPPYALFVFSGFAPWIFIGNAVAGASPVFLNNFEMINKIYFPRGVLPLAAVAALTLDGCVAVAAVLAASSWFGYGPAWSWLLLPVVGAAAIVLAMAAALTASSLTTLLRDIKNAVPFLVQLWMYASPVLYPVSWLPAAVRGWAGLNPVTGLLEAFRACLFGTRPEWALIAQSAGALAALIAVSGWLFYRLEADLAERV